MTTEEKHKLLSNANIDESIWDLCTIDNDGIINTPNNHVLYENGLILEEYYLNWKELIGNNLPLQPSPDDEVSILKGQVVTLEVMGAGLLLENANQQVKIQEQEVTNANMLLELASLKGGM